MRNFAESFYKLTSGTFGSPIYGDRERQFVRGVCKELYELHGGRFRRAWREFSYEKGNAQPSERAEWFSQRFPTIDSWLYPFEQITQMLGEDKTKEILLQCSEMKDSGFFRIPSRCRYQPISKEQLKEEINNLFTNKKENNK